MENGDNFSPSFALSFLYTRHIELRLKKISSEVYNLYGNAKVSFAGSLRNVDQILVVSSLLHSRTDCLSIYIIIANSIVENSH